MGQAAGFPFNDGSHGHFVPLLSTLVAPKDDAVPQCCTALLQGTGSVHVTPAELNGSCFPG